MTEDAEPVPVISASVPLLGSPADQLPALFQRPVPALLVKVSLVTAGLASFDLELG